MKTDILGKGWKNKVFKHKFQELPLVEKILDFWVNNCIITEKKRFSNKVLVSGEYELQTVLGLKKNGRFEYKARKEKHSFSEEIIIEPVFKEEKRDKLGNIVASITGTAFISDNIQLEGEVEIEIIVQILARPEYKTDFNSKFDLEDRQNTIKNDFDDIFVDEIKYIMPLNAKGYMVICEKGKNYVFGMLESNREGNTPGKEKMINVKKVFKSSRR